MKTQVNDKNVNCNISKIKTTNFIKNSDRNIYPLAARKSSSKTCETSLESFRKQKTVTNISTSSMGVKSLVRSILSIHIAMQALSAHKETAFIYTESPSQC
jgi:hypothetical protein